MRKKLTIDEFIRKTNIIHNNFYDYSDTIYKKLDKKVCIICVIHGKFYQIAGNHLKGYGCSKCSCEKNKSNTKEFIIKAKNIHGDKYDYSKVNYINSYSKVDIVCKKHGSFFQAPNNHLVGYGCDKCGGTYKLSTKIFIKKANVIHNNFYDYSETCYKTSKQKIIIICPKHGKFKQTPNNHLTGYGCSKCIHKISKPEIKFLNFLNITNRNIYINPYIVDGIDLKNNIVYEFLGDYWHGNPEKYESNKINHHIEKTFGYLYKNTMNKLNELKKMGYIVKYIWESDWKKFERGINKFPKINNFKI